MPYASGLLWRRPPRALEIQGAVGGLPKSRRGGVLSIANGILRPGRGEGVEAEAYAVSVAVLKRPFELL